MIIRFSRWAAQLLWMYCAVCMVRTNHTISQAGDYETITCSGCGNQTTYRVR